MEQDYVLTTVKKDASSIRIVNVKLRCGPDFVWQMIPQVRGCHRKGTITPEPFGTWNITFQHIPA